MKVFLDVQKLRDLGQKIDVSENGIATIFEETTLQLKPGLRVRVTVTTRSDSSALRENLDLRIRPICDTEDPNHELQSVLRTWQTALRLAQMNPAYWSTEKMSSLFNCITMKLPEVNFEDQALRGMIVYLPGNFRSPKDRLGGHHLMFECIETVAHSSNCPRLNNFDSLWKSASIFGVYDFGHIIARSNKDSPLTDHDKPSSGRGYSRGSSRGGHGGRGR